MTDPGRLKTRLAIEAPLETDDGQGGVARSFTTVATVWAAVTPVVAAVVTAAVTGARPATTRRRSFLPFPLDG